MFNWFSSVNLSESISNLRLFTFPLSDLFPNWFLYSLPDGLWLFSCTSILLVIWNNRISNQIYIMKGDTMKIKMSYTHIPSLRVFKDSTYVILK
jgi:hypothetical protein